MKIAIVLVSSLNAKTTKGNDPHQHTWASREDQDHFYKEIKKAQLIIMGRKTYEVAKPHIVLTPKTLRVVLTKSPEKYSKKQVKNQLEFSSDNPKTLVKELEKRGYKKALLVGGEKTNTQFLKDNLVNYIHLTIEPFLFGSGKSIVSESQLVKNLTLESTKKLNKQGTLLAKYKVNT